MGNAQASNKARRQPEWFLKNTVAGGGKFTSLNGWRTKVPGWKPVLLLPNGDMSAWVVPPKTVISGRPLRVVRSDELGSAAVLLESFGNCLLTFQEVPLGSTMPVTCTTASLEKICQYLSLTHAGAKQGRMQLAVVVPQGGRRFTTNKCPELEYVGETANGQPLVAFRPSSGGSFFTATAMNHGSGCCGICGIVGCVGTLVQTQVQTDGRIMAAFKSKAWTAQ